jgi:DNA-binding CsgD family transcriptional regulator
MTHDEAHGIDNDRTHIPAIGRRKTTATQRQRIVELYNKGASCAELGNLLGFSEKTIRNNLKAAGVQMRRQARREPEYRTWRGQ